MAPALLNMQMDALLWQGRNEMNVGELWKLLCTYCYLPRLASFEVLQACIQRGVDSEEYFAYADGVLDGKYVGLKYNKPVASLIARAISHAQRRPQAARRRKAARHGSQAARSAGE